jgi:hypothetical protein
MTDHLFDLAATIADGTEPATTPASLVRGTTNVARAVPADQGPSD